MNFKLNILLVDRSWPIAMMYSYSCSYRLDWFEKEHIRLVTPRLTDREKVSFSCVLINVDICGENGMFYLGLGKQLFAFSTTACHALRKNRMFFFICMNDHRSLGLRSMMRVQIFLHGINNGLSLSINFYINCIPYLT